MDLFTSLENLLPTYTTTLPFSKNEVLFTPFRVKDAKNISIILQEDNKKLALHAMIDLLKHNSKGINVMDLCLADAEFLFLQIRSKSVDEQLNLIYNNEKVQIFIPDIQIKNNISNETFNIGNNISVILETPTLKDLVKLNSLDKQDFLKACIKKVVVDKEIFYVNKFLPDEIHKLLENLPINVMPKFESFLSSQPELYVSFQQQNGTKEVSGILNFFISR